MPETMDDIIDYGNPNNGGTMGNVGGGDGTDNPGSGPGGGEYDTDYSTGHLIKAWQYERVANGPEGPLMWKLLYVGSLPVNFASGGAFKLYRIRPQIDAGTGNTVGYTVDEMYSWFEAGDAIPDSFYRNAEETVREFLINYYTQNFLYFTGPNMTEEESRIMATNYVDKTVNNGGTNGVGLAILAAFIIIAMGLK